MNCPLCRGSAQGVIYTRSSFPAFQNKVYVKREDALNSPCFPVELVQCATCGFVWNHLFHAEAMEYDELYQNEQGHSLAFKQHLDRTLALIDSVVAAKSHIIEVGCGKGFFLAMMRDHGYTVTGYDPAHEAGDPDVVKTYFDRNVSVLPGDLVVLRHTLEHVSNPVDFLQAICDANGNQGNILIETPRFEWIVHNRAFWDIFHEHCNYFTESSLSNLFASADVISCFEGQYMWLLADIGAFRPTPMPSHAEIGIVDKELFSSEIECLKKYVASRPGCLIWGAGAKGISFVNQIDPDANLVKGLIDINPQKQGRFVAKTGHPIYSPSDINELGNGDIILMNDNYKDEIQAMCVGHPNALRTSGEI